MKHRIALAVGLLLGAAPLFGQTLKQPPDGVVVLLKLGTDTYSKANPMFPAHVAAHNYIVDLINRVPELAKQYAETERDYSRTPKAPSLNDTKRFNGAPDTKGKLVLIADLAHAGEGNAYTVYGGASSMETTEYGPVDNRKSTTKRVITSWCAGILIPAKGLIHATPEEYEQRMTRGVDWMHHEFSHLLGMLRSVENAVAGGAAFVEQAFFKSSGAEHTILSISDPVTAFEEGAAEARQLFRYKGKADLGLDYVLESKELWVRYRELMPEEARNLTWVAEQSVRPPSGVGRMAGEWPKLAYDDPNLQPPQIVNVYKDGALKPHEKTLRTLAEMKASEGLVCLILNDLYEARLATPELLDLLRRSAARDKPLRTLDDFINTLKDLYQKQPSVTRKIQLIESQRYLGANLDEASAGAIFRQYSGDPEEYDRKLAALIESKIDIKIAEIEASTAESSTLKPSTRVRLLEAAHGGIDFAFGQTKLGIAMLLSHVVTSIVEGRKDTFAENVKAAALSLADPAFLKQHGLFLASHLAAERGFAGATDAAGTGLEKAGFGPQRVASLNAEARSKIADSLVPDALAEVQLGANSEAAALVSSAQHLEQYGGIIAMLVATVVVEKYLAHDWSFLIVRNDLSTEDKLKLALDWITDFSLAQVAHIAINIGTFTAVEAAGTAVLPMVISGLGVAVGPPTMFVGTVLVTALAMIASWVVDAYVVPAVEVAYDQARYDSIIKSVNYILDEHIQSERPADPGLSSFLWLHMEDEDKKAIQTLTGEEKQKILRRALGTPYAVDSGRVTVGESAKLKGVVRGTLRDLVQTQDARIAALVAGLSNAVKPEQTALNDAVKAYDRACNPFLEGFYVRKATILMGIDRGHNRVPARELADQLVRLCLSDPNIGKMTQVPEREAVLPVPSQIFDAKLDAWIDSRQPAFENEIEGIYREEREGKFDLTGEHYAAVAKNDVEIENGMKNLYQAYVDWQSAMRRVGPKFLTELSDIFRDEYYDLQKLNRRLVQLLRILAALNPENRTAVEQMTKFDSSQPELRELIASLKMFRGPGQDDSLFRDLVLFMVEREIASDRMWAIYTRLKEQVNDPPPPLPELLKRLEK